MPTDKTGQDKRPLLWMAHEMSPLMPVSELDWLSTGLRLTNGLGLGFAQAPPGRHYEERTGAKGTSGISPALFVLAIAGACP